MKYQVLFYQKNNEKIIKTVVVIGAFMVKQPLAKTVMIHVFTFFF